MVTFWIIAAVVVLVGFALAWWSSGRQRHGVDADKARMGIAKSQGEALRESNRPAGQGPFFGGPLS
jgi:hypothetical protein